MDRLVAADPQLPRHAGQGRGQHGAVQLLHEHGGADDQGDGAEMGLAAPGGMHDLPRLGPPLGLAQEPVFP